MTLGNQNNLKTKKKKDMDLFFMSAEENDGFWWMFFIRIYILKCWRLLLVYLQNLF